MFWKSAAVGLFAGLGERWVAWRKRRGVQMRYDRKTDSFVVSDWPARIERGARFAWNGLLVAVMAWWVVLAWLLSSR